MSWFKKRVDRPIVVSSGVDTSPDHFPDFVKTSEQRHRWRMAYQAAQIVADDLDGDEMTLWLATRSLYNSDIPTDGEL